MPTQRLKPKQQRTALRVLGRDRLSELTDHFAVEVGDRRVIENHVDAIVRSRSVDFADVLARLKRPELKAICEALGLDAGGRELQPLIDRILSPGGEGRDTGTTPARESTTRLNPATLSDEGSEPLRPRARIIRALGEDLISNEIIALAELIKNAYDADAHEVTITFEPPLERGSGAIVVSDDGHGMPLEVFKRAWLEPATISKRRKRISPGGRRVTGEKGLGRFAAARLADRIHIASVAERPRRCVIAELDWESFRDEELYLDEIDCQWREHRVPRGTPTGTTLRLVGLHDEWKEKSVRRLRGELARLIARSRERDDFRIELRLPAELQEYSGPVTPPDVLRRPHYSLAGRMSADGRLVAEGEIRGSKARVEEVIVKNGHSPVCGPFQFEFKAWDRDRGSLGQLAASLHSTIQYLRSDLNEACGVSIYRDFFRVLPYGDPANDWLRLDLRRVQNPTMRLSNNQIVGEIYITADENPELRDQTNREGLVESPALDDLKDCVKAILAQIEQRRYAGRSRRHPDETSPLFSDLGIETIVASFKDRYPDDKEFQSFLNERAEKASSSIKRVQEVIVRYRRLATLGQLVDVILHDGRTPIASISNECDLALRDIKKTRNQADPRETLLSRLETISRQTEILSALFRRIAPFGGRKRGRPTEQPVEALIADAFAIYQNPLRESGVRIHLPESTTMVTIDATEMQQIIVNLLDNAIYWLQKVPEDQRAITVEVRRHEGGVEIIFADSGLGVPGDVADLIFDPYFSTKPDGVGLGLTIAGEVALDYDGALELVPSGLLPGANFRVTLRRRISEPYEGTT